MRSSKYTNRNLDVFGLLPTPTIKRPYQLTLLRLSTTHLYGPQVFEWCLAITHESCSWTDMRPLQRIIGSPVWGSSS